MHKFTCYKTEDGQIFEEKQLALNHEWGLKFKDGLIKMLQDDDFIYEDAEKFCHFALRHQIGLRKLLNET